MDQKRPYNDIANGDTAPVPPVSGDTVPLPAPGEGTPAPETDKAAPENGAPSPETAKTAPEPEKKPDAKKAKKKAPREKRSRGMSRGARTALAVGDAAISTVGDMVRFIVRIVLSVLLVLLLGGLLFACIFAYYVKNTLTTDLNITLEDYAISLSSTVWAYDNNGQTVELAVLATDENRIWVDYDELPPYLEKAAVAIEDKRFYDHKGVDWYRTAGAFVNMFLGMKNDFGGSTITQQLVKNITGRDEVTVRRKLVEIFSVLDNIILGVEPTNSAGFLKKTEARRRVVELSEKYGLRIEPDALISDITVGMQQRTEILKMLYRNNEILIFDEPTAVLTPQEIDELMEIMRSLAKEGKSILFISHKLNEIMAVADRCTVLRKGKYIGTVNTKDTTPAELSAMMVGRNVNFHVEKKPAEPGDVVLEVKNMTMASKVHKNNAVKNVSFQVRRGEIVCIAGIDGNGQTELVYGLTGLEPLVSGELSLCGQDITHTSIRKRSTMGMSHIPEDRHKHGLVLDYSLEDNMVLQRYFEPEFTDKAGFLRRKNIRGYAERLIEQYDVRSGQGPVTIARSMSGGNQQKAIVAREIDKDPELLVAVQPTRGLDVGAIEYIHRQLVAQRDEGKAVLLVSLELDEVMDVPDRILVMYEGEIVGELDPKTTTQEELGLYMAGAKRDEVKA